jgi:hypothetical protein
VFRALTACPELCFTCSIVSQIQEKEDWINSIGRSIVRHSNSVTDEEILDYDSRRSSWKCDILTTYGTLRVYSRVLQMSCQCILNTYRVQTCQASRLMVVCSALQTIRGLWQEFSLYLIEQEKENYCILLKGGLLNSILAMAPANQSCCLIWFAF